ncbi:hypothetical protein [Psychrobacter sp. I-STPA6b]|uniref:hypothetical protein n=1 Tax=Psychrobacter sp. I-STPA6b TaxID=2585718 RepID=UPI001D0CA1E2|nr:hypothetical protein [Psychrobacter sp. I-STPA6b]
MSFVALLILLSLILVVPLFFVLKERSIHQQKDMAQRHRQYLQQQALAQAKQNQTNTTQPNHSHTDDTKITTSNLPVIQFSKQHPYVKLLHSQNVPQSFRLIMDEIGEQYESTHHEQLTESQLFTLNKLIDIRIPELINNYLQLDKNYANSVIINKQLNATSYDVVMTQLQSILDFSKRLNMQSQSGVVDKLLASQLYLEQIYQDSGMKSDSLSLK